MTSRAADEIFSMPALGYVAPETLIAKPVVRAFDFERLPLASLAEVTLPFAFSAERKALVHGLAGWFDVAFEGTTERVVLSTAPGALETHWSQLRFVLLEPLTMNAGQKLTGALTLRANSHSSYTATLDAELEGEGRVTSQVFGIEHYFPADEPP
jgi:histone-arginine methyltransferase CARM1